MVDVKNRPGLAVDSFTVQAAGGGSRTFTLGTLRDGSFSPSHLSEHRATAEAVRITYEEPTPGRFIAVKLEDAGNPRRH